MRGRVVPYRGAAPRARRVRGGTYPHPALLLPVVVACVAWSSFALGSAVASPIASGGVGEGEVVLTGSELGGLSSAAWTASQELRTGATSPSALLGYDASALGDLREAQPLAASTPISLGISLVPQDPAGLYQFVEEVSTPGNSLTGHFLTMPEYEARFSPSLSDELTVEGAFEAAGFRVTERFSDRSFLLVNGTAGEADAFFSTRLVAGDLNGSAAVLPEVSPSVPPSVAPYVMAVSGLSQQLDPTELAPLSVEPLGEPCLVTCDTIYPDWTHFMYGLDKLYNTTASGSFAENSTIGLLLWGDGYDPSDISQFLATMYPGDEPQPTVEYDNLLGAPAPSGSSDSDPSNAPMELTLDIEWSASQAPGATIDAVYVPDGPAPGYSPTDPDLETGLATLVNTSGITVISQSFGAAEGDESFETTMNSGYETAAALGISVFAASGDNGGSELEDGSCSDVPQVEFPAASPYVTAVGGTAPLVNSTVAGTPETKQGIDSDPAWHLSGGGYSTDFQSPAWQRVGTALSQVGAHDDERGVPDVAGPAGNDTFFFEGSVRDGEGTSFASPTWAGMIAEMAALHGGKLGFLDPKIYALGAAEDQQTIQPIPFQFISYGQDPGISASCYWDASQGWDPVTGYGSPLNALNLYADLVANYINLTIAFNPAAVAPGTSVSINVAALNGSSPLTSGSVTITVWSLPQTLHRTVELTSETVTLDAQGDATLSYAIPVSYLYGQILVQAEVFSKHDVGSTSAVVPVTLLGSYWESLQGLLQTPWNYLFFALVMGVATALGWVLGLRSPKHRTHAFTKYLYRRQTPTPVAVGGAAAGTTTARPLWPRRRTTASATPAPRPTSATPTPAARAWAPPPASPTRGAPGATRAAAAGASSRPATTSSVRPRAAPGSSAAAPTSSTAARASTASSSSGASPAPSTSTLLAGAAVAGAAGAAAVGARSSSGGGASASGTPSTPATSPSPEEMGDVRARLREHQPPAEEAPEAAPATEAPAPEPAHPTFAEDLRPTSGPERASTPEETAPATFVPEEASSAAPEPEAATFEPSSEERSSGAPAEAVPGTPEELSRVAEAPAVSEPEPREPGPEASPAPSPEELPSDPATPPAGLEALPPEPLAPAPEPAPAPPAPEPEPVPLAPVAPRPPPTSKPPRVRRVGRTGGAGASSSATSAPTPTPAPIPAPTPQVPPPAPSETGSAGPGVPTPKPTATGTSRPPRAPRTGPRGRTTCPQCGRAVAPSAKTCPNCRANLRS